MNQESVSNRVNLKIEFMSTNEINFPDKLNEHNAMGINIEALVVTKLILTHTIVKRIL